MRTRLSNLVLAIGLIAGVAGPAAASPDAGTFAGDATVGKQFQNVNTGEKTSVCTAQTAHQLRAQGTGLFFPQALEPTRAKTGTWHFKTTVDSLTGMDGQLDACGTLGPNAAGLGASCGMSRGVGAGKIRLGQTNMTKTQKRDFVGQVVQLTNIEWKTSAGGVLPVTADVSWAMYPGKTKKPKTGKLVAEVLATGGAACANTKTKETKSDSGAQTFAVTGSYEILQP